MNMLISQALAAANEATTAAAASADAVVPAADVPTAGNTFMTNMGMIALMFVLFYVLLIRPQQKRLKQQQAMLSALKVGDRVVTGGGLIGTITRLTSDSEVEVDLGNGNKVTALRYTLSARPVATAAETK